MPNKAVSTSIQKTSYFRWNSDLRWRPCYAVLKANILFAFSKQDDPEPPFLILIIEDCFIELCDENKLGKDFTFEIKYKTTGRSYIFAAEDFKTLERWVSLLTITPIDYMLLSKQSFAEQIERAQNSEEGTDSDLDIIDEALMYFKPNIFFREFEIKGPSDRTLIYLTLYITECLRKLQRSPNKISGQKDLAALALSHQLPIPGEADFPLNNMYKAPANKQEEETMRSYLQQMRQELGVRLCELAFPDPSTKPSKWWLSFARKRFMDKGLVSQGVIL
ncbi:hypothetical protein Y032_1127g3649 [Ancylostoma ceylanicum]|uniref:PH domain-containing protein n=1 Tax=Ancylostoma ceylanicum TaxID=53326 RepID=A0A016W6A5_9BILA|nr:hypothetical protein Y032_1127g3649 [Ancylostoma ceylanicum]